MAKVWPVYEGTRPTAEWPWARLPLSEATALFELKPHHFVSDLSETPRVGAVDRDLTYAGNKHIVVEIEPVEAWIQADPAQLQQVLINLADNAQEAMPEGGELRLHLSRRVVLPDQPPPVANLPPG